MIFLTNDVIAPLGLEAIRLAFWTFPAVGFNVLFALCGFDISGSFSGQYSSAWLARMPEGAAIDASLGLTIVAHHVLAFTSIADLAKPAAAIRTFLKHFRWHQLFEASNEKTVIISGSSLVLEHIRRLER